jgi:uncharacterized protein YfbU (UPF0304 family)
MQVDSLTPTERKILINQFEILKKLDPCNSSHYEEQFEIVSKGYAGEYDSLLAGVYEELPKSECDYVRDVLQLHSILLLSFNELEDKEGLTASDIEFRGFDGNNEIARHGYAKFLNKREEWTEINGSKNSHSMITMSLYPKMLQRWEEIGKEHGTDRKWRMTADDIKYVIAYE